MLAVHWLDLATLLGVAFQFVVPPSGITWLIEEAVTVYGWTA